jgi:diguanylate cyclase (GGDEF)-like protein
MQDKHICSISPVGPAGDFVTSIVAKLREINKTDRRVADEVRRSLVETLFVSSTSLGMGAIAGSACSTAIALSSQDPWIAAMAVAIGVTGALRMLHAVFYHKRTRGDPGSESTRSETVYEIGAWVYALLLGLMTLLTLVRSDNAIYHMLASVLTIGYAAGFCGRNAGRPVIAIGQLSLAASPVAIGLLLSPEPLRWVLGGVTCVFVVGMVDITLQTYSAVLKAMSATQEQKILTARFERLARYDAMTGLENRAAFQERLQSELAGLPDNEQLAILWLDLDKFKEINDSLGHPAGDRVLCTVARQLTSIVDGRGSVARFGGDEFVLLCRGSKAGFAEDMAREVIRAVIVPMDLDGAAIQVTGSIGLALAPTDGNDSDTLLQHADMALYHAKSNGRNDFCTFKPSMEEEFLELRQLEAALRVAVEREELQVHYQPIIDLKTGMVRSCEALLRWTHPELGPISPARFIPLAESTGLITPISHWVLSQACTAAASWPEDVSVAVNMSPALLKDLHLSHMILSALYTSGLQARRLELEITESVLLEENAQSNSLIKEFQKIGLKLSIDDFGTGYSSLTYLKKYRFDKIKIDTSFIADVTRSREARAIIHALVGLAAELNMDIVAEGIETETQLGYVTGARCTMAQGFFVGRPVPQEVISRRLHAQMRGEAWTGEDVTLQPVLRRLQA